jgi:sulfite dehydrogenase (quinone) subunit SoeC
MNPAWSIVLFTTLAGCGQGLAVAVAGVRLAGQSLSPLHQAVCLLLALLLVGGGLLASFFHLGHPMRAWRAASQWRTSWMSREVIVLPLFMLWLAAWVLHTALRDPTQPALAADRVWALGTLAGAALLWWCTAMIYACLRFIQEWAHPLTLLNYTLTGLSAGGVLAVALFSGFGAFDSAGPAPGAAWVMPWALGALLATLAAAVARLASLRRNARLKPRSTLQSATGIHQAPLRQWTMGFTGGSFNTREFFHRAGAQALRRIRWPALGLGYAAPALLLVFGLSVAPQALGVLAGLAVLLQTPGLWAERWLFFAQARHPQNLYYQAVA